MKKTFLYVLMLLFVSVSFLQAADNFYEVFNDEKANLTDYQKRTNILNPEYLYKTNTDHKSYQKSFSSSGYGFNYVVCKHGYSTYISEWEKTVTVGKSFYLYALNNTGNTTWWATSNKFNPSLTTEPIISNFLRNNPTDIIQMENYRVSAFFHTVAPGTNVRFTALKPGTAYIYCDSWCDSCSMWIPTACKIKIKNEIKKIQIDKDTIPQYMLTGQKHKLKVKITPENATNEELIWKSSDENIATVKNGEITISSDCISKDKKTVKITVSTADGKKKDSCTIPVYQTCFINKNLKQYINYNDKLNNTILSKSSKEEYYLYPAYIQKFNIVYHSSGNYGYYLDQSHLIDIHARTFEYNIDKPEILSVDKTNGKLTINGTGYATITATSPYNNVTIKQTFHCFNNDYKIVTGKNKTTFDYNNYMDCFGIYNAKRSEPVTYKTLQWTSKSGCVKFDNGTSDIVMVLPKKTGEDTITVTGETDKGEKVKTSIDITVNELRYFIGEKTDIYSKEFKILASSQNLPNLWNGFKNSGLKKLNDFCSKALIIFDVIDTILQKVFHKTIFETYISVANVNITDNIPLSAWLTDTLIEKQHFTQVSNVKWKVEDADKEFIEIKNGTLFVKKFIKDKDFTITAYDSNGHGEQKIKLQIPEIHIGYRNKGEATSEYMFPVPKKIKLKIGEKKDIAVFPKENLFLQSKDTPPMQVNYTLNNNDYIELNTNNETGTTIITGKKIGTVKLKASSPLDKKKFDIIEIEVVPVKVDSVIIEGKKNIIQGSYIDLHAKVLPENATNKKVKWVITKNPSFVNKNEYGNNNCSLYGIHPGPIEVKVITEDGKKTDIIRISVLEQQKNKK